MHVLALRSTELMRRIRIYCYCFHKTNLKDYFIKPFKKRSTFVNKPCCPMPRQNDCYRVTFQERSTLVKNRENVKMDQTKRTKWIFFIIIYNQFGLIDTNVLFFIYLVSGFRYFEQKKKTNQNSFLIFFKKLFLMLVIFLQLNVIFHFYDLSDQGN